jgi:predicted site-specific integrase-resolvase
VVKRPSNHFTGAELSGSEINRVALYARVSTLNNQDPEMQLAELREYAARRGWQIIEEFTDQGVSGCKESRPEPMCGKFFLLSRRQGSLWDVRFRFVHRPDRHLSLLRRRGFAYSHRPRRLVVHRSAYRFNHFHIPSLHQA